MRRFQSIFFLLVIVMMTAPVAHAALATPSGLSPGDQFYWVFITSAGSIATSTDISAYNTFVDNEAAAEDAWTAEVAGDWKAIGSTADDDARDNVGTIIHPIYDLNGNMIAMDGSDLWDGSIAYPIGTTQYGTTSGSSAHVWTGTQSNGTVATDAGLGSSAPMIGENHPSDINKLWIEWKTYANNEANWPMYAISPVQTVVPSPSALWLLGSGLIGIVGIRRKFKK